MQPWLGGDSEGRFRALSDSAEIMRPVPAFDSDAILPLAVSVRRGICASGPEAQHRPWPEGGPQSTIKTRRTCSSGRLGLPPPGPGASPAAAMLANSRSSCALGTSGVGDCSSCVCNENKPRNRHAHARTQKPTRRCQ